MPHDNMNLANHGDAHSKLAGTSKAPSGGAQGDQNSSQRHNLGQISQFKLTFISRHVGMKKWCGPHRCYTSLSPSYKLLLGRSGCGIGFQVL